MSYRNNPVIHWNIDRILAEWLQDREQSKLIVMNDLD